MNTLWRVLISRKLATYLLTVMIVSMILSTFVPSEFTMTQEEAFNMKRDRPAMYWVSENLYTPGLVKSAPFIILSAFLFLSTLACTFNRISGWIRNRRAEFEKEHAFSFAKSVQTEKSTDEVRESIKKLFAGERWEYSETTGELGGFIITAEKGGQSGFWGSIAFHLGLLLCFLAAPVTYYWGFNDQLRMMDGETVSFKEGLVDKHPASLGALPDFELTLTDLKGEYYKGLYKMDFSGRLKASNGLHQKEGALSVNNPFEFMGYTFEMGEFGFATKVVLSKKGRTILDQYLMQRGEGSYFKLESEEITLYTLFLPDFFKEGSKVGSKTREVKNPYILATISKDDKDIAKGLVKFGESGPVGDYQLRFDSVTNWGAFAVAKEPALPILWLSFCLGVPGLLIRFLSNQRRIEFEIVEKEGSEEVTIRGYSRYYPAFLEGEVGKMAESLTKGVL